MGQNLRRGWNGSIRIGERRIKAAAEMLDYGTDRQLRDEVRRLLNANGSGAAGLPVEIAPVTRD
jgi:hypothetical protein